MRSTSISSPGRRACSSSAARQASRTAPAAIHVIREADAEPAESTVAVCPGASRTSSMPELGARDLQDHAGDALPDLGRGAVHLGRAVGEQAHARGAVVVEALRVRDVLEADREADAATNALAVRRVAGAAGQAQQVARQRLRRRRLERGGGADRLGDRQRAA